MPKIIGLEEQRQALSDIQSLLKEIPVINNFLRANNASGLYEISFVVENSEVKENSSNIDKVQQEVPDANTAPNPADKKTKRTPKSTKLSAPFLCEKPEIVRTYVLYSKKEKVNRIRDLSHKYNIFLDDEEETILTMFAEEM